ELVVAIEMDRVPDGRGRGLGVDGAQERGRAADHLPSIVDLDDRRFVQAEDVEDVVDAAALERVAAKSEDAPSAEGLVHRLLVGDEGRPLMALDPDGVAGDA